MTAFRIMLPTGEFVTDFEGPIDLDGAAACAEEAGYDVLDVSEPDIVVVRTAV